MPSDFTSARNLLPGLLAKLARESGRAKSLLPVWAEAAGPLIAAQAIPDRIDGDALIVIVPDRSWLQRIEEHAKEIGARLSEKTKGQLKAVRAELRR